MAQNSNNPLSYRHISQAAQEAVNLMHGRKHGTIKFLRTAWPKLNKAWMKGIEWNCIITIGGISGSGKSSIADELETSLIDLNPDEKFAVLSFNWEMVASRRVVRKISSKVNMTVKQLLSAGDDDAILGDGEFDAAVKAATTVNGYPIYYVDTPGTPDEVLVTFNKFRAEKPEYKKFLIMLDHTIMAKGKQGEKQNTMLEELQKVFVYIKKYGAETKEYDSIVVQLSQLNRGIESTDRMMSLEGHYPKRSDLFGGDSVYQASDYVLISHRPELLHLAEYGPLGLPVKDMVYFHCLKQRDGEPTILKMKNNLKYNRIDEA